MSIASEITRLQGAKSSIKTAIEAKGVTVPANALLDSFATYIGQISGGGSTGLEYETGTYTPAQDISQPTISFTNQHTVPPAFIILCDVSQTFVDANSIIYLYYIDIYRLFGAGFIDSSAETIKYAMYEVCSRGGSTSTTYNTYSPKYNSDNTASNNTYYSRFFATPSSFKCYAASTKYFRTNRTYKWIAIWK